MFIKLYTKRGCPFCTKAVSFLEENNIVFTEYILGENFLREFIVDNYPTAKTYPVIVIDDTYIGGYTDLKEHFNSIGLNKLEYLIEGRE